MNMSKSFAQPLGYKRTTDMQYELLTREMNRVRVEDRSGKSPEAMAYWHNLTENLNHLGPPYRTIQQWKKVWTDFRRFHMKKNFKSTPKFTKRLQCESNMENNNIRVKYEEEDDEFSNSGNKPSTSSKVAHFLHSESDENEQSCQSMLSTNSNDFGDEYSYPDRQASKQFPQELPDTLTTDQNTYEYCNYSSQSFEQPTPPRSLNPPPVLNHRSLPPLTPANNPLLEQTLYTMQHQMENESKLLEHLSQISSTMAGLMERQVNAVEKQTEAIKRQAIATEHHTLVMNSFIDMLREKMTKTNTRPSNGST